MFLSSGIVHNMAKDACAPEQGASAAEAAYAAAYGLGDHGMYYGCLPFHTILLVGIIFCMVSIKDDCDFPY